MKDIRYLCPTIYGGDAMKSTRPLPARPTLETVEICLLNSQRLFSDAEKVSTPTAAALLELCLEEIAKGWMLYFTFLKQKSGGVRAALDRSRASSPEESRLLRKILSFYDKHEEYFENPSVDGAFYEHKIKLDYLKFLIELQEMIIPVLTNLPGAMEEAQRAFSSGILKPQRHEKEGLAKYKGFLSQFNKAELVRLQEVKNDGIYANLSNSGAVIAPASRVFPIVELATLCNILGASLMGTVLASKDNPPVG
jgi:hypothetical protein